MVEVGWIVLGVVAVFLSILLVYMAIRGRSYFKKSLEDPQWKKTGLEPYSRSYEAAAICGLAISFMTVLFYHYFHSWQGFLGMLAVDMALLLVLAYPAKKPVLTIGVLSLLVIPAAYLDYGPYAYLVAGPLEDITGNEGLGAIPEMAGNTFHCVTILLTNPMAYEAECVLANQQKAPEESKTPKALEETSYKPLPEKDLHPGQPLTLRIDFENQGDYPARNVIVVTNTSSGATYRVCEQGIFEDVLKDANSGTQNKEYVLPGQPFRYSFMGIISDPWTMGDDCTYAVNKAKIDAKIMTNVSYRYATESTLAIEAIRSYEEAHKLEARSALSKSAPMEILMLTVTPLSWGDERFNSSAIDVSLKNSHKGQKIIFKGKYEFKKVYMIGSSIYELMDKIEDYSKESPITSEWEWVGQTEQYDYCKDKSSGAKLGADNATECVSLGGEPVYKSSGQYQYCLNKTEPYNRLETIDTAEICTAVQGEPVNDADGNYDFCRNRNDPEKRITLIENGEQCTAVGGDPVYRGRARRVRNEGEFDEVVARLAESDNSKYFKMSCYGETSKEEDEGGCLCNDDGKECRIRYVGGDGNLVVSSAKSHLFSGLKIELVGFPDEADVKKKVTTTIIANATYSVEYSKRLDLLINNPHYIR